MIATFPAPPGSSIGIGPLDLRMYGLLIAIGVIAAVWLFGRRLEQRRFGTPDDASAIAIWAVGAGLIGARLYHVMTDWSRFSDDLGRIPAIWEGGLGIPGGLVAGVGVGLYMAHRKGIPMGVAATCAAPGIPLAQAIGRWGNWFNQELFGRPTDLPWALEVDPQYVPTGFAADTTFHPTFLYESLWTLALAGLLILIDRKVVLGPGRLLGVYVLGYGLGRFWIEGLRIDRATELAGLRWNQWIALAMILGGALYLVATRGRNEWPEPTLAVGETEPGDPDASDLGDLSADRAAAGDPPPDPLAPRD
ncbi:prolipoprotein diacylglyceryl transferase [soil metagenome]